MRQERVERIEEEQRWDENGVKGGMGTEMKAEYKEE